ncbi:hypothetical protein A1342_02835 [Methylomonas methanica]|uniref:Uncharacterized protein n=1 Tax=Methylomonas denitrificans TaxID=1538553 RepID=A0A140E6P6_9GAMM|nr:hypothetical protein JT25_021725 [Methylomonas denitrificans]OAI09285.1 hypothetical protein A1342_02835 [Methylomonas methanica]
MCAILAGIAVNATEIFRLMVEAAMCPAVMLSGLRIYAVFKLGFLGGDSGVSFWISPDFLTLKLA